MNARNAIGEPISTKQIMAIKTLQSKLQMNDDGYHAALWEFAEAGSCTELSKSQATKFISDLSNKLNKTAPYSSTPQSPASPGGAPSRYTGNGKNGRSKHLTPARANRIEILEDLLGWTGEEKLTKFIKRQVARLRPENILVHVNMLSNKEASKVIIGMQRVFCDDRKLDYEKINMLGNKQLKEIGNSRPRVKMVKRSK